MSRLKLFYSFFWLVIPILFLFGSSFYNLDKYWPSGDASQLQVLLVYNPLLMNQYHHLMQGYQSLLEEEGVPFKKITATDLLSLDPGSIVLRSPGIIFPDGLAQILPNDLRLWLKAYLSQGGHSLITYDAGIKDWQGKYLDECLFADILGLNYITYSLWQDRAYTEGYIQIENKQAQDFLEIPSGKLIDGRMLGGYIYGGLIYPIARNKFLGNKDKDLKDNDNDKDLKDKDKDKDLKDKDKDKDLKDNNHQRIYAYALTQEGKKYPLILVKDCGGGKAFYVNLPLGHLKTHSDDLPLRAVLRSFLFKVVKIPHILNVPQGKGGLVINWHIDANLDWQSLPFMVKNRYIRKGLEYSFHVTAGEFRDQPGDNLGFDACGQGRKIIDLIKPFGVIGSHGGWAHNWFAYKIINHSLEYEEIKKYISQNNECLASIVNYHIDEYSAPNGLHPQPITTFILEELGILSYYYTGDTGSGPNRTFIDGKIVSDKVIAFPIMPFQTSASLGEMKKAEKTESEVESWLFETTDYIIKNKIVRLIYSHPYDLPNYPKALSSFLDHLENKQYENKIQIRSMGYFSKFILKFLKTEYSFCHESDRLKIVLKNPEGLRDITVAIPKNKYTFITSNPNKDLSALFYEQGVWLTEDEDYYYLNLQRDEGGGIIIASEREK